MERRRTLFIHSKIKLNNLAGTSGLGAVNRTLEIVVPILVKELKPLRIRSVSRGVVDTPWCNFLLPANKMLDRNINFTSPPEEEEYGLAIFENLYENLTDLLQRNEKKGIKLFRN